MSWKTQGGSGINKLDSNNNISVNSIVSDIFTLRQSYNGLFDIQGSLNVSNLVNIKGNITAESNLVVYENVDVYGNIIEKSDIILYNNLYFGSDLSNYMFGDIYGIGVNNSTPNASFDICGNRSEILNVYSNQPINRNTLAQNNTNKGRDKNITIVRVEIYDLTQDFIPKTRTIHNLIEPNGNIMFLEDLLSHSEIVDYLEVLTKIPMNN